MRSGRPGLPRGLFAELTHHAVQLGRGALDQLTHLVLRLAEAAQHVRGDDLRVRAVGTTDADAEAAEVGAPQSRFYGLEAVVARQAAPQARLNAAERQIDLVVDHDDVVEVDAELAARRADRLAGVVHVGLRQEHAHARAAGAGAAVGVEAGPALLRVRQPPALGRQGCHLEADVVARARVAVAGVAQSDD